jgi:aminopeptidase N
LFVQALAEQMGQPAFDAFIREYVEEYRWQIATTADFKALAEQRCACDLTALFTEWVYPK